MDLTELLTAIYSNGRIVPDGPIRWAEGTKFVIRERRRMTAFRADCDDVRWEDLQADDPESVERWIAALNAIPPLQMTASEKAAWHAARQAQRDFELSSFDVAAERLERPWGSNTR